MRHVKWSWLFVFLFVSFPLFADKPTEKKDTLLKMGGELRIRSETTINQGAITGAAADDDSMVLLRARPYMEATPTDQIRVFLQPQFSRTFAQEESTIANGTNLDDFDLHQGYIDFLGIGEGPVSIRLGRQELAYGTERLMGTFGWSNVGRSHDAAKITLGWEKFWVDSFFSWVQRAGGNQYYGGGYGHWDVTETIDDEPFFIVFNDNDGAPAAGRLTVYTIGNRLTGMVGTSLDFNLEGALQFGKSGGNDIFAYAGHGSGGFTFDTPIKPRVGLEYNIASGDSNPTGGTVKTFNNLIPTNHDKYGYMDFVGWRNIHNPRFSFSLKPAKDLTTALDYHAFFLMNSEDGLYRASGARMRAGAVGASRFVGQEIDWLLKYKWNQWANFLLGYSFFKAGDFLADTGMAKDAHFLYAKTQVNF